MRLPRRYMLAAAVLLAVLCAAPAAAQETDLVLVPLRGKPVVVRHAPDLLPNVLYVTPSGELLMLKPAGRSARYVRAGRRGRSGAQAVYTERTR